MALNDRNMPGFGDLPGDSSNPNSPDYREPAGDDRTAAVIERLCNLPTILGEVALDEEQSVKASAALKDGDLLELARIWIEARDQHVERLIEVRQNADWHLSEYEAAKQLLAVCS